MWIEIMVFYCVVEYLEFSEIPSWNLSCSSECLCFSSKNESSRLSSNCWCFNSEITTWNTSCPTECQCYTCEWQTLKPDTITVFCENSSLFLIPANISSHTEALVLKHNFLGHSENLNMFDLVLTHILLLDLSFNQLRSLKNQGAVLDSIICLNLSHNYLLTLPANSFRPFPNLQVLDLSFNRIATIFPLSLELPKLRSLDLTNNRLDTLFSHYFVNLRSVEILLLSNNHISRVSQTVIHHIGQMQLVNLENNRLAKLGKFAFQRVHKILELRLSGNLFTKIPTKALQQIPFIKVLDFSRNPFRVISSEAFTLINVSTIILNENKHLFFIESKAFVNLPKLTHLDLSRNPKLTYIDTDAFKNVPELSFANFSNNKLETVSERILSTITNSFFQGNPFYCDCTIRWIQDSVKLNDIPTMAKEAICRDEKGKIHLLRTLPNLSDTCPPRILPLFPLNISCLPSTAVSFLCSASGVPVPNIQWILNNGYTLSNGECHSRFCVRDGILSIRYLHGKDSGIYTCLAFNKKGNVTRYVALDVKDPNIQLFALTVASHFVTLSWNTTSSIKADFILQYREENSAKILSKSFETGITAQHYTLSGLKPGTRYTIWLCLKTGTFIIPLNSVQVMTREEDFLFLLGIRTNYVSIVFVSVGGILLVMICGCFWIAQIVRCCKHHQEMVLSESSSQRCFNNRESNESDLAFMTFINTADEITLMDQDEESSQ